MFNVRIGKLLGNQLIANCSRRINPTRQFSRSPALRDAVNPGSHNHKVDNMEKRFLVWTGKFKSMAEVPDFVSSEVMERARNRMRIRVANIMIGLTVLGCIIMVISGKKASERGESVTKQNLEWHKQYNEQKAKEN